MSIHDDDLRAYLDGQADAQTQAKIETALAADPQVEDRMMALDPLTALAKPLQEAWPRPASISIVPTPKVVRPWWQLVAASVGGAILMAGILAASGPQSTPDWRANVAVYQALYAPETIASLAFEDEEKARQIADAAASVGLSDLANIAQDTDTLTLLRTQMLSHEGQAIAQIVFATPDGQPVALCLLEGSDDMAMALGDMEGLASASFSSAGHSWLLIGTTDLGLIQDNAAVFQDRLAQQS